MEFVAMRRIVNRVVFATLLLGSVVYGALPAAAAAIQDGNWTVMIVTEKGNCDRGYSYDVTIANGHVSYQGAAPVNLNGTVASNGAVNVSIKLGDNGAVGRGHLSAKNGAGTWHGAGANGSCGGRWEAVRR
jgi:hypothetical protein